MMWEEDEIVKSWIISRKKGDLIRWTNILSTNKDLSLNKWLEKLRFELSILYGIKNATELNQNQHSIKFPNKTYREHSQISFQITFKYMHDDIKRSKAINFYSLSLTNYCFTCFIKCFCMQPVLSHIQICYLFFFASKQSPKCIFSILFQPFFFIIIDIIIMIKQHTHMENFVFLYSQTISFTQKFPWVFALHVKCRWYGKLFALYPNFVPFEVFPECALCCCVEIFIWYGWWWCRFWSIFESNIFTQTDELNNEISDKLFIDTILCTYLNFLWVIVK